MINKELESKRWLDQARFDLSEAKGSLGRGSYAYTCFFAEQAAQKFLKGFLISRGERFVPLHSIKELLSKAAQYESKFNRLTAEGQKLDRYYLITRYPDALPSPNTPYESYDKQEAREVLEITEKIEKAVSG